MRFSFATTSFTCNCGALHLPLVVYNYSWEEIDFTKSEKIGILGIFFFSSILFKITCIVLKVDELSVLSSEGLPLPDDYSRHHLPESISEHITGNRICEKTIVCTKNLLGK